MDLGVPRATKKSRQGTISTLKETLDCEALTRWTYPKSITVSETEFVSSNAFALDYTSTDETRLHVIANSD